MRKYTIDDYRPYFPLWAALILAYVLFALFALVLIPANNRAFYPDNAAHYRLTWTHYLLPAVGALFVYLFTEFVKERYGVDLSRNLAYHFGILVLYFVGYFLGIYSFGQTFVYYSGRFMDLGAMWRLFIFLPYWALLPGLLGAQIVLLLWPSEKIKRKARS
jgi:hypothetical protein